GWRGSGDPRLRHTLDWRSGLGTQAAPKSAEETPAVKPQVVPHVAGLQESRAPAEALGSPAPARAPYPAGFLHQFTTHLAQNQREICREDRDVSGMAQNHSLAWHIQDAAWDQTRRPLEYQTVLYGSKLTLRDRFYARSKLAFACGSNNELLLWSVRVWRC